MGNSTGLQVRFDDSEPVDGNCGVVSGKVGLQVEKDCTAKHVEIKVSGYESCSKVYHSGSGKNRKRHVARNSINFFELTYSVAVFDDGKVQKGQYEYPFQVQLPVNSAGGSWPSSMSEGSGDDCCKVGYVVKAELCGTGNWISNKKPSAAAEFLVMNFDQPPAIKPTERQATVDFETCKICCCFLCSDGNAFLRAKADKDAYQVGEEVNVLYEARNKSLHTKVERIKVSVVERVRWNANGHEGEISNDAPSYQVMMPAEKLNDGGRAISLEEDPCSIKVPTMFRRSYNGRNVNVTHVLAVELTTNSNTSNPTVEVPLSLYNPGVVVSLPSASLLESDAPESWHPSVGPAFTPSGTPLTRQKTNAPRFCGQSGGKLIVDAKFCSQCGSKS